MGSVDNFCAYTFLEKIKSIPIFKGVNVARDFKSLYCMSLDYQLQKGWVKDEDLLDHSNNVEFDPYSRVLYREWVNRVNSIFGDESYVKGQ